MRNIVWTLFLFLIVISSCAKEDGYFTNGWVRSDDNPIVRDTVLGVTYNYEVASDAHVFLDENSSLKMIYTGDVDGKVSIKLASGISWNKWTKVKAVLYEPNSAGTDIYKETAFYRKSATGKHQIFYIGYENEETFESQIFLAEADILDGDYYQKPEPVVQRGMIAGKNVYCITSPSVVEHEGVLHMVFIGWNAKPSEVTEVWIFGAKSTDGGHNWSEFQLVDTKIGMEGQLTKKQDGSFVSVRTGEYKDKEAIFYATAKHPFGPWDEVNEPVLIQAGAPFEKDEIIAAQITIDINTGKQYLYYTGADHQKGYWIMMATKE